MRVILYLIVFIEFTFQQVCFSQKKIHWRIYDQNFTKVATVNTKNISIAHDLIWYEARGKYGAMDIRENVVIKPQFEKIDHYQGGMTSVGVKGCFGMVYKGKQILPLKYDSRFSVDTSGYFTAQQGCSENPEAYIIGGYGIHDAAGKVIWKGCQDDVSKQFLEMTGRKKNRAYDKKAISNGFIIKLMPTDKYVKKGIYNRSDSLIFSCTKCFISDNVDGEFFINQVGIDRSIDYEQYTIDTLGRTKIRGGYKRLYYYQKLKMHLYERGMDKGFVDSRGNPQVLTRVTRANASGGFDVISKNRFLLSVPDSSNYLTFTICDSLGRYLFAPTKDLYQIIGDNCLIHKTPGGYIFTDADGKPVSNTYDSVFAVPDFDYFTMVLGETRAMLGVCDASGIDHLGRDGFSPVIPAPEADFYGILRAGKMGLFNIGSRKEILPEYALVARINKKLITAKKDNRWIIINNDGEVKSLDKGKYINFLDKYILIGN
jgi:hypothetical protein